MTDDKAQEPKGAVFNDQEDELKAGYVQLSESTGEPLESIADRVEHSAGDKVTAAKLRALAKAEGSTNPKQAPAPKESSRRTTVQD